MVKASAALLLLLALTGGAAAPQAKLSSDAAFVPKRFAWDGAGGEDPNRPMRAAERLPSARTAASAPAQNGSDLDQDAQLNRSIAICKGCLRSPPADDKRLAKASD